VIKSFQGKGTQDIWNGEHSKAARHVCPMQLTSTARRKLFMIDAAVRLDSLSIPPGNRLEALKGNRAGQHAIRINDQYRVCFRWKDGDAYDVEIVDYH
jgi:proteic killer suppression protein